MISVIVPAHNSEAHLQFCLDAIEGSDLPRQDWELIVVDDASSDATPAIAAAADKLIRTRDTACGPAYARNRGAEAAAGDVLVFIDADVAVHKDALRLLSDRLSADAGLVAVFGAYDDAPSELSLISQYRNLLHHYTHWQNAGEVPTFWAGCGAVRTKAFREVGGFNEKLYPRPQIEDIEIGYRLHLLGRILLDPLIQGTHYKRWYLWPMIRTDFRDRAVPWFRLLLSTRRSQKSAAPSLGPRAVTATVIAGSAAGFAVLGAAGLGKPAYVLAAFSFVLSLFINRVLYLWFFEKGGYRLGFLAMPLHFIYLLLSALAVPVGAVRYMLFDRKPGG